MRIALLAVVFLTGCATPINTNGWRCMEARGEMWCKLPVLNNPWPKGPENYLLWESNFTEPALRAEGDVGGGGDK